MLHGRREDRGIEKEKKKPYGDEFREIHGGPAIIHVGGGFPEDGSHGYGCCMEEIERVLEEYSQRGQFAFGSFWGRGESNIEEFESNVVYYHLFEVHSSS